MKRFPSLLMLTVLAAAVLLGGRAIVAQNQSQNQSQPQSDKYAVQIPDGLSISAFRGYEDWAVIAVSQTDELVKAILGNPAMIEAYRTGAPGNGKPFPDGAKMAKIMWSRTQDPTLPGSPFTAGALKHIDFMEKDAKRFAASDGWGYAQIDYDEATAKFTPFGSGVDCGAACHKVAASTDYVFTAYGRR